MVRSTILFSAVIACIGAVSAIPTPGLLNLDGGDFIGLNNIDAQDNLNDAVSIDNLQIYGMFFIY